MLNSGILSESEGAWHYKSNDGNGLLATKQVVKERPNPGVFNGGVAQLTDSRCISFIPSYLHLCNILKLTSIPYFIHQNKSIYTIL
jgi:hypothetical protein